MSFGKARRREILERAGFQCEVCGAGVDKDGGFLLFNAHSADHTHTDEGVCVCGMPTGRMWGNDCHAKIHRVTRGAHECTEEVTDIAVNGYKEYRGVSYLDEMVDIVKEP